MHKTRHPITFTNDPNIRLRTAEYGGWQIQIRETEIDHWIDVPNGYYRTEDEAVIAAGRMIE